MRIIRGKHKGRSIKPPANYKARPTTDIAKEALFNILDNRFNYEELKILDLFSGTGSISYEFYSRGCTNVTSVEISNRNWSFIKKNIQNLQAENSIRAIKADVLKFIRQTPLNYDIIFADPPFDADFINELPERIFENEYITPETLLILEHSANQSFQNNPFFQENRKYGKVLFSFFSKQK